MQSHDQPKLRNNILSDAINSFLSKTEFSHRFSQSSKEEQILSDSWSPLVNEAYNCLKKPILRANYLLMLNGRPLEENENIRLGNLYHETCFLFCEPGYLTRDSSVFFLEPEFWLESLYSNQPMLSSPV